MVRPWAVPERDSISKPSVSTLGNVPLGFESRQGRHMSHPNTYRGSYVAPDLRNRVMNSCSKLHFW